MTRSIRETILRDPDVELSAQVDSVAWQNSQIFLPAEFSGLVAIVDAVSWCTRDSQVGICVAPPARTAHLFTKSPLSGYDAALWNIAVPESTEQLRTVEYVSKRGITVARTYV